METKMDTKKHTPTDTKKGTKIDTKIGSEINAKTDTHNGRQNGYPKRFQKTVPKINQNNDLFLISISGSIFNGFGKDFGSIFA